MKNKIILALFATMFSFSAQAGAIGDFFSNAYNNSKHALFEGDYDLYVPVRVWHNRLFYDDEHIEKYNEEPWGIGLGRSFWDGNEWHGVYAMGFKDSNFHLETMIGYAYQYNWNLDEDGDFKAGIGYTLGVTQREEYYYIPVPLPLPIVGVSYKDLAVQAAYVPGVKNDGNVLFVWMRYTF